VSAARRASPTELASVTATHSLKAISI